MYALWRPHSVSNPWGTCGTNLYHLFLTNPLFYMWGKCLLTISIKTISYSNKKKNTRQNLRKTYLVISTSSDMRCMFCLRSLFSVSVAASSSSTCSSSASWRSRILEDVFRRSSLCSISFRAFCRTTCWRWVSCYILISKI